MMVDVDRFGPFELDDAFLGAYRDREVAWGFGALSWITFKRSYARDGEAWWQTCRRVIEGMMTVERVHCLERNLRWDETEARAFAQDAYERMFSFKWTPPGRGLWIMGTRFMYERGGAALNNCGFISTRDIARDYADPFAWMMRMTMLGVGVGFDTRGAGTVSISKPTVGDDPHVVGDSREGWAAALRRLLQAYVGEATLPSRWDVSEIRLRGTPLEGFGGVASGPGPLKRLFSDLGSLYAGYAGRPVDARLIVDTMNLIGRCVVAGGIRRSAQIAFGRPDDATFLDLKRDEDAVESHRWVSNNSVLAEVGMDYREVAKRTVTNGEPGYLWLDQARSRGRFADPPDDADDEALGTNPCAEQTLWDRELCTLAETYPAHHDTLDDYLRSLHAAYRYAKAVTLVPAEDPGTRAVMLRNRRIGCSMTGIVQAIHKIGYRRFMHWCDRAYATIRERDRIHSDRLRVPRSIKLTTVKPSGTVSLLAGATPGVHWDHAPYYLRRLRISSDRPLVQMCRDAGYAVEPDRYADDTHVVSFPVHVANMERRKADVPVWEKVDLASQMQRWWSDNQVSCTAEFDPDSEADHIVPILRAYEDRLKALVFLPASGHGYEQPPYEAIDADAYERMTADLQPLEGDIEHEHEAEAKFCEGGACDVA